MKYLLFLTFFVLTLFVNAQDKMGFGNDTEGADSAGFGTITTWIKSIGEITYTGTLTVGSYEESYYGYGVGNGFGSISPDLNELIMLQYDSYRGAIDIICTDQGDISSWIDVVSVKIDENVFTDLFNYAPYFTTNEGLPNPFPAVGQTCSIEIKYTLP